MAYILVVDDDPDIVHALVTMLRAEGYDVSAETDTSRAMESIKKRHPDLIMLDVMFPDTRTGGFDLARAIRKELGPQGVIPIIMMSAINSIYPFKFSSQDIDDEWLPVTEFVDKPVNLQTLKAKVELLLSRTKQA